MRKKFNQELYNWLVDNSANYTCKELIIIAKERFNEDFTLKQMQQYFWHHNLSYKYEQKNKSHSNHPLPIGSERIKADGMVQVKVGPKKWEYKQRLIYERHYGKLPDNMYVIFLDQNRRNFDISNLKAISASESGLMANLGIFSQNPNVTKTGIVLAKQILTTKEKKLWNEYKK